MLRLLPLLLIAACAASRPDGAATLAAGPDVPPAERVRVGRFQARSLWTPAPSGRAPAVLMLPGSGAQGPEEMIPASLTVDGRDAPLFSQIAAPFVAAGLNVLSLGKPGIEFFDGKWEPEARVYDQAMVQALTWEHLLANARDALAFLRAQPTVDPSRIYVLGHSEGTQVASDLAKTEKLAGLVFLGYSGEDLLTTLRWQLFEREIEWFLARDVDHDRDGWVTRAEAARWPEFSWPWQGGEDRVAVAAVAAVVRSSPEKEAMLDTVRGSTFCRDGHCARGPLYDETARLRPPIWAFTGALDLQTRAVEARQLGEACRRRGKGDCTIEIIPGVQHGFSPPRPPRGQPVLDVTVGPVGPELLGRLDALARSLR